MRERYPILRDISASIRTRRTVEEAELALKLEGEYRADPTLFEDIDFEGLIARIDADARAENVARISTVLTLTLTLPLPLPLPLTLPLTLPLNLPLNLPLPHLQHLVIGVMAGDEVRVHRVVRESRANTLG